MDSFKNFSNVKVLVVGDVMLDKYLWGTVTRISPEAPVPVVHLNNTSYIAGGSANVAANVAGLGATPYLIGIIGDDDEGKLFPKVLESSNVSAEFLVREPKRQTTIKTRVIAQNQQIVRIDQETNSSLTSFEEEKVWQMIESVWSEIEVIVISDYNKGLLSKNLTTRLITSAKGRNIKVLIDPKGRDYTKYTGATILTPNKFEIAEICQINYSNVGALKEAGQKLLSDLRLEALLITRGEEGMTLFTKDNESPVDLKAEARHVYDVTGAGDTVLAAMAVALGAGESFSNSARIANIAAGLVVSEVGTTTIKIEQLRSAASGE